MLVISVQSRARLTSFFELGFGKYRTITRKWPAGTSKTHIVAKDTWRQFQRAKHRYKSFPQLCSSELGERLFIRKIYLNFQTVYKVHFLGGIYEIMLGLGLVRVLWTKLFRFFFTITLYFSKKLRQPRRAWINFRPTPGLVSTLNILTLSPCSLIARELDDDVVVDFVGVITFFCFFVRSYYNKKQVTNSSCFRFNELPSSYKDEERNRHRQTPTTTDWQWKKERNKKTKR